MWGGVVAVEGAVGLRAAAPDRDLTPRRSAKACSPLAAPPALMAPWSVETLGSAGERGTKAVAVSLVGTLDEISCWAQLES